MAITHQRPKQKLTVVVVPPTITTISQAPIVVLSALTFSATTFAAGTPSSGTITGATPGSAISASGLPTGLTIDGVARTWAWDGTGSASTGSFTLTETLAGAANSPHPSTVSFTISAAFNSFLGIHPIDNQRFEPDVPFTNLFHGEDFSYVNLSSQSVFVPSANRDANGWVTSVPADSIDGLIYYVLRYPIETGNSDFTWDSPGVFDHLDYSGPNFSIAQTGPQHATVNFTATVAAAPGVAQIKFIPNATNPPKNWQIIPSGRSGTFTPEFITKLQAFKGSDSYVRFIKWLGSVEGGYAVTAAATRSTAIWADYDGVPWDVILTDLCAPQSINPWLNVGLLENDATLTTKANALKTFLLANTSLKAVIQSGNENWNSLYFTNQTTLRNSAAAAGLDGSSAGVTISSITHSGTIATVTTASAHGRTTGDLVTVLNALPVEYSQNNLAITVTGSTTFTYDMSVTPATNATSVGTYRYGATDIFGGQLKAAAARAIHVMDLFSGVLGTTLMARVKRTLDCWNVSANTIQTMLGYSDTPAHLDAVAVGAYWANVGSALGYPSEPFPANGTTRTSPLNVQYTTADFDAILTDLKAGTDAVFDNTELNRQAGAAHSLELLGYEWGPERHFSDSTIAAAWYASQQAYDSVIYAAQEWERRFNVKANYFVETGAISNESNAGRSLQLYLGQPLGVGSGKSAKGQAVLDYNTNTVRKPNALVATLSGHASDTNGTQWGQLTKFVVGSTVSIQSIVPSGGGSVSTAALTLTPSGQYINITAANVSLLPQNTYTVTFRETDSRFPSPGYRDTALTLTVAAALNNTHKYRYYQFEWDTPAPPNGGIFMRTAKIAATPGGADTAQGITVTATSSAGGFPISHINDGDDTTNWADDQSGIYPQVVTFDYGATSTAWIAANEFTLVPNNALSAPANFKFRGSDDNVSFTTLKTITGATWVSNTPQTWTV